MISISARPCPSSCAPTVTRSTRWRTARPRSSTCGATAVPDLIVLDLMMPVKDGWQFRVEQRQDPALAADPGLGHLRRRTSKAASIDADGVHEPAFSSTRQYPRRDARIIESKRLAHLDRMASLGTLAAGIAHEINNPLTYVISNCSCSRRSHRAAPGVGRWAGAPTFRGAERTAARRLEGAGIRNIVLHVKTFSRAGDEHRRWSTCAACSTPIKIMASELRQRAQLVKAYDTPLVRAGYGQLGQVFLNMLLNASACHREAGRRTTKFAFAPTGTHLRRPVEDRLRGHRTPAPAGSAPSHLRPVLYDQVDDRGNRPRAFHLPRHRAIAGGIHHRREHGRQGEPVSHPASCGERVSGAGAAPEVIFNRSRRGRILVVDDEPRLAEAIRRMLVKEHDVTIALDAGRARSSCRAPSAGTAPFDIILCDLYLPGMTGMNIYDELLQKRSPLTERMVFMTGGAWDPRAQAFVERVGNPFLEKPVDIKALRALLGSCSSKRKRETKQPPAGARPTGGMRPLHLLGLSLLLLSACAGTAPLAPKAVELNRAGTDALSAGDLETAEARFALALEYHPRFVEALTNLGLVEMQRGNLALARRTSSEPDASTPIWRSLIMRSECSSSAYAARTSRPSTTATRSRSTPASPPRGPTSGAFSSPPAFRRGARAIPPPRRGGPRNLAGRTGLAETLLRLGSATEGDAVVERAEPGFRRAARAPSSWRDESCARDALEEAETILRPLTTGRDDNARAAWSWIGAARLARGRRAGAFEAGARRSPSTATTRWPPTWWPWRSRATRRPTRRRLARAGPPLVAR